MDEKILEYLISERKSYENEITDRVVSERKSYKKENIRYVDFFDESITNDFTCQFPSTLILNYCNIIELDISDFTYRNTFSHEWLYIGTPELLSRDELFMTIRLCKLKKLKTKLK